MTFTALSSPIAPMSASDAEPAIALRGLAKRFGAVRAVDGVDLTIQPGEVVALLGPNGAGKTTMLDLILGFAAPSDGTVEVFGSRPSTAIGTGRVSAVLQDGGLLGDLTVARTIELIDALHPGPKRAGDVSERAGLGPLSRRRVSKLSGGERQRLRFALALLGDPDLLVLDEPTAGMDVGARRDFWDAIRVDAAAGRTIVFATHYLAEADDVAERVVVLAHGKVMADGAPAQVRALATGRVVRAELPPGTSGAERRLGALPGVTSLRCAGGHVTLHTSDSDLAARVLLTELGAHDLEVAATSLEDAFVALTSDAKENR